MNTPILYVAYGSNLNPKRITRRCPTAATFRTAKLKLLLAWGLAIGTVRQWIARRTK